MTFQIQESLPPVTTASVSATEACLSEHPPLRALAEAANEVYRSNQRSEHCN
jgi:hypothetical protein